ncbi:MAG: DUF5362 family protein [Puia sp.]|nr:DUF5362 family protein [Puia sp.]
MEQNTPFEQTGIAQGPEKSLFDLQVDHETTSYLGETARWAKFIAVVGFVSCGLLAIFGLFAGSIFGASSFGNSNLFGGSGMGGMIGVFLTVVYVGLAVLYFFPCLYLFNFASKMKVALHNNDQIQLNTSLKNLKSCFKFMGIMLIIILGLYGLILVGSIIGAAFR